MPFRSIFHNSIKFPSAGCSQYPQKSIKCKRLPIILNERKSVIARKMFLKLTEFLEYTGSNRQGVS